MHDSYPPVASGSLWRSASVLLISASLSKGALVINALENEHLIDFDSTVAGVTNGQFTGAGFSPTPTAGQLDSDTWSTQGWASGGSVPFGGTATTGEYARGSTTAAVASTGIYSFGTTDRQLLLQGGNTAPNTGESITLKLENQTDTTITGWTIGYEAFRRNDSIPESWLIVDVSTDGTNWYHTGHYFNVFMDHSANSDSLGWVKVRTHLHTFDFGPAGPLSVTQSGAFYIRWRTYLSTGGNIASPRDEWGIDNIRITAIPESSAAILPIMAGAHLLRRKRFRRKD